MPNQDKSQMTGNESAAALAMATNLQTAQITPEQPQEASQEEKAPEDKPVDNQAFDEFKKEITGQMKQEVGQIKDMIQKALEDEKD